ncbi:rRNA-processing protein BFR2 NDAI_0C04100 [Naumovozyma dairenensis CBS 421]|uniref:Protein BFR2 n=1 Tax=Naumovozyma dairenensis (strain ATCC 10597 / BCRC 20456 / CBS 421 / NBRC 0211 / NRRL Y-12639) TaxID=1071378 RepID=G0W8F9_NAUDC|nr:hypothetical protein NDAI_0C04100 [Naumovozyma dairenensis CBS 421]CCD24070.1 hypothetical protein NDAI_0C04100 [Naumovozyma dairenensis CBS 421]
MTKKQVLLADKIASKINRPKIQDFDIEDEEHFTTSKSKDVFQHKSDDGSSNSDSDIDNEGEDELEKAHYLEVGKSKLRADTLELNDTKYHGAVGSRKDLFNNEEPSRDELSEQDDEENSSDALSFKTDSEDEIMDVNDNGNDSESSNNEEEEEREDNDEELQRLRLAKLIKQETKQSMNKLSQSIQRDASKGYSITKQNKLFDNIIDLRIKLQKAVTNANKLPITKESWEQYEQDNNKSNSLLTENSNLLTKVLSQLIDFRKDIQKFDNINQNNGEEHEEMKATDKKRTFKSLTNETNQLDSNLQKYRKVVLHKWSKKIDATSGNSALSSNKFKSINQPTDIQVENQLSDLTRLRKRTLLNRRNVIPLGFQSDLKANRLQYFNEMTNQEGNNDKEEEDENLDIPKNYDPRRKDNNAIDTTENPYIFDDEDFYRVLLNDMVDKKIANVQNNNGSANNNSANVAVTLTSRSNNKLKKNIDTKASKGRKLNYSIQESIANYETPINNGNYKWNDDQIDEFFAGLLGQRINFNEDDEEEEENNNDEEQQEDVEAIKNDDIQIFG